MAESPSSENSALHDSGELGGGSIGTQPPPVDWEVLSMSTMSASTLDLPPQSEITAEAKDRSFIEKEASDTSGEPFTAFHQPETQDLSDSYISTKDTEDGNMQPPGGLSHEGAEGSGIQEEDIPAASSKKKKIRVFWSKHQVFNWQPRSQKYSAVLSIALVAAVVGIAVIGHRLRRERNINHQLRLDFAVKEEKLNDMMYQVTRMKEAMTGRRRIGITRNSFF